LANKAVSAILSLLIFFLIAEKESKIRFPIDPAWGMLLVHFLLAVQKKVNIGFSLSCLSERKCEGLLRMGISTGKDKLCNCNDGLLH